LLLPALIAFLRTEKLKGLSFAYFFLLTLPFFTYPPRAWQDAMLVVCVVGIYLLYAVETIGHFRRFFKERKENKATC
jgi:hypothetical protein